MPFEHTYTNSESLQILLLPKRTHLWVLEKSFERHNLTCMTVGLFPVNKINTVVSYCTYQEASGPTRQWPVGHVCVARDPTNIRRAPEHIIVVQVEHILEGGGRVDHVPTTRVQDPLWLACRAAETQARTSACFCYWSRHVDNEQNLQAM